MREIGIICPPKLAKKYSTRIKYVVPKTVDGRYLDFLEATRRVSIILMDCRDPSWKRAPADLEMCRSIEEKLKPDYIILPSYMFDYRKTIEACSSLLNDFHIRKGARLVGCLEGTTSKEVLDCLKELEDLGIKQFAAPSHIYKFLGIPLSKIGFYIENKTKLEELDDLRNGILLTSLPLRLGLEGRLLSDCTPSPPSLTFKEEEDKFPRIVQRNIQEALEWAKS